MDCIEDQEGNMVMILKFNIHGVKLRINTPYEKVWKYYSERLWYFKQDLGDSVDLDYYIGGFSSPELPALGDKRWGSRDSRSLLWQPFRGTKVLLSNLSGETIVWMTKWFSKFFSDYLASLLRIKLIQNNCTLLHGAGVCNDRGEATILCGTGGAGKTSLTYLLTANGYNYLGDDHIILSKDGSIYPFPTGMGVDYNTISKLGINMSLKKKLGAKIRQLPLIYSSVNLYPIPYSSAKLKNVVLVERRDGGGDWLPIELSPTKIQNTVLSWSEKNWGKIIYDYACVDEDFDYVDLLQKERDIIDSGLRGTKAYLMRHESLNLAKERVERII